VILVLSGSSSLEYGHCRMASVVREPITRFWGRSPQRGPGAKPLVRGSRGKALWSWNTSSFWTFNGSRKFAHISKIWKRKKVTHICVVLAEIKFNKPHTSQINVN